MPGFDGTGPRGMGPFSGGGRGYCALVLPPPGKGQAPYGYAGVQGTPVRYEAPSAAMWPPPPTPAWCGCGRRHGWGQQGRR